MGYLEWHPCDPIWFAVIGSYADPAADVGEGVVAHGWDHGLGEIVNALIEAGLRIESLTEHPFLDWGVDGLIRHPAGPSWPDHPGKPPDHLAGPSWQTAKCPPCAHSARLVPPDGLASEPSTLSKDPGAPFARPDLAANAPNAHHVVR